MKSIRAQRTTEAKEDVEREGVAVPQGGETHARWPRRRKIAVALLVVALAAAITGVVAISMPTTPPIPASLPIPSGTVFSLQMTKGTNGSVIYTRDFSGSANGTVVVPTGQCILLEGAWSATTPTFALGASANGMNGTMNQVFLNSSFSGGAIHFTSLQPDTITVTQTIQYVATACP